MPLTHSTVPELFSDIADAIRAKGGTTNSIVADTFPDAIASLPTGGGGGVTINNQNKIVTPTKSTQVITKDNNNYTGLGTVTVNPIPDQYIDTSSTTATATTVRIGDIFYNSSGVETVGTLDLKRAVIRPDAELIQTISYDKFWVSDNNLTIPNYTTATTTVQAAQNLTPSISLNLNDYDYFVLERTLVIPQYSSTTITKGREEYMMASTLYEVTTYPANTFKTVDGTKSYASRITNAMVVGNQPRFLYWSSTTAVTVYNSAAYGFSATVTAPALSSATSATPTMTIKLPIFIARGNSTYFTSANWSAVTDVRTQFVADVYRVPKTSPYTLDGWGIKSQMEHMINCFNTTTDHKIT